MSEFIRARSHVNKEQRMSEIKEVTDTLFSSKPYSEITLTTIADQLSCTRANLYKYVTTKEEIFLEICTDKRNDYFAALKSAFPTDCDYSIEVYAEVWAGILNARKLYLDYYDILSSIIETNVTVPKLAEFKRKYYEGASEIIDLLSDNLSISKDDAYTLTLSIHYHAVGIWSICKYNQLVEEALKQACIDGISIDFKANLKEFIEMNLKFYIQKNNL